MSPGKEARVEESGRDRELVAQYNQRWIPEGKVGVLVNEPVERREKGIEGRLTWGWWMET